jgi:hypothetical protein
MSVEVVKAGYTQQPPKEEIMPLLKIINAELDRLLTELSGNNNRVSET